jgi:hypothetical protein
LFIVGGERSDRVEEEEDEEESRRGKIRRRGREKT